MCNRCSNACRSRILLVLLMFCLRSSVPICGWRAVISEWLLACLGVFSKRKLRGVYTLSCKAHCHLYRIVECVRSLRATFSRVLRTDDWDQIRCQEVKSAYACPDESRRSRSMLNGYQSTYIRKSLTDRNLVPLAELLDSGVRRSLDSRR